MGTTRSRNAGALLLAWIACAMAAPGCARGGNEEDAGSPPPLRVDGGVLPGQDAGPPPDAGPPARDPSTCTGYVCPSGMTLSAAGDYGACMRTVMARPNSARRYCQYLADYGVIGFSWTPVALVYMCPDGMESAPNMTTGYCLYRDVAPPEGFEAICDEFESSGEFGFRFPCDR
ncbi:MAG: hypothetical protein AB7S26_15710 [Sandaracinaceae bacterium]